VGAKAADHRSPSLRQRLRAADDASRAGRPHLDRGQARAMGSFPFRLAVHHARATPPRQERPGHLCV